MKGSAGAHGCMVGRITASSCLAWHGLHLRWIMLFTDWESKSMLPHTDGLVTIVRCCTMPVLNDIVHLREISSMGLSSLTCDGISLHLCFKLSSWEATHSVPLLEHLGSPAHLWNIKDLNSNSCHQSFLKLAALGWLELPLTTEPLPYRGATPPFSAGSYSTQNLPEAKHHLTQQTTPHHPSNPIFRSRKCLPNA